ncbi:MAG: dTDP-4-dehydrorhamnose reductase [Desulfuromonadales bacterium]|nr:dTDP-4-dehydrorhamnose reductase [Desulfuromonadales bacterium]
MVTGRKRLALIGANGMLASMVIKMTPPDFEILAFDLPDFDITDREQVLRMMQAARPQVIVNCAAYTNVDGCESQEELATRVNGDGPGYLAEAARGCGATLVHVSTDYVFDGRKQTPYTEEDPPNPLSAYGRSKLRGEEAILASGLERFFILRTSWLYGPGGKNFVETIARLASERDELRIVADQVGTPTCTEDLAKAIFNLLHLAEVAEKDTRPAPYGIYHFSSAGHCSWHQFSLEILAQLRQAGIPIRAQRVVPLLTREYPLPAIRPHYSVFAKEKYQQATGAPIPPWQESLGRYLSVYHRQ